MNALNNNNNNDNNNARENLYKTAFRGHHALLNKCSHVQRE